MAEIALEKLTKVYGDGTRAVSELDLEIDDGEFVVLVGPSGCGKTSALRMVAGLEPITDGRVVIGGEVVNKLPPKDRDIAMIFQNYALYPHMSAFDNMAFGLKLRGMKRERRGDRVKGAAQTLGLAEVLPKKPRTLSGGQRQRVAMGRAIVREPRAFLMDEPLSNLDAKLRVEMRAEIARPMATRCRCPPESVRGFFGSTSASPRVCAAPVTRSPRRSFFIPLSLSPKAMLSNALMWG